MKYRVLRTAPLLGGIVLLSIFSGCSKDNDTPTAPAPGGGTGVPAGDHGAFSVDGQSVVMQSSGGYAVGSYAQSGGSIGGIYQEAQGSIVINALTLDPPSITWLVMKSFDTSTSWSEPNGTQIQSMFHVQSYPFGKSHDNVGTDNMTDGALVNYTDATGVQWSSDLGSADQAGSSFQITAITPQAGLNSHYSIAVTFHCKVYDGNGNMKTLTNGSITGPAEIY